jgi:hypothetical protein
MLAKAKAKAKAKVKDIYSTDVIYHRHLRPSKYFCNTGHWFILSLSFFKAKHVFGLTIYHLTRHFLPASMSHACPNIGRT